MVVDVIAAVDVVVDVMDVVVGMMVIVMVVAAVVVEIVAASINDICDGGGCVHGSSDSCSDGDDGDGTEYI